MFVRCRSGSGYLDEKSDAAKNGGEWKVKKVIEIPAEPADPAGLVVKPASRHPAPPVP